MAEAREFRILGPLEIWQDGEPVLIRAPRQRALLALLLLRANEVVPQSQLIEELWPGSPPRSAKAVLQNQVSALRRRLGADLIETRPPGYLLRVQESELDLARFERLIAEAREGEPQARASALREALSLWRGLPLVEFPVEAALQSEILRLEELHLGTLEERIEADLALERHSELVPELEALVERHSLRERLWGQLMVSLYRSGRQAEALAQYRRAHEAFVENLGIEPGPALKELQRAILVQDPWLAEPRGENEDGLFERAARFLPGDASARAQSLIEYGGALWRLGERRRAQAALREAMRFASDTGERAIEERARLTLSWYSIFAEGRSVLAHLDQAERSAKVFEELEDLSGLALALRFQAHILRDVGRASEAAQTAARAIEIARSAGDRLQESWARVLFGRAVALGPTPVLEAIAAAEEEDAALDVAPPGPPAGLQATLGWLYAQAGRLEEGLEAALSAVAAPRLGGDRDQIAPAAGMLAWVQLLAADEESAIETLRDTVALLTDAGDHSAFAFYSADLARVLAREGEDDEAERHAIAASTIAAVDDFTTQVLWRRALAIVAARAGRVRDARHLAGEAAGMTEASDWLTFHGETLEDTAEVELLSGARGNAADALGGAIAVFERKGNVTGAERARRRLVVTGAT